MGHRFLENQNKYIFEFDFFVLMKHSLNLYNAQGVSTSMTESTLQQQWDRLVSMKYGILDRDIKTMVTIDGVTSTALLTELGWALSRTQFEGLLKGEDILDCGARIRYIQAYNPYCSLTYTVVGLHRILSSVTGRARTTAFVKERRPWSSEGAFCEEYSTQLMPAVYRFFARSDLDDQRYVAG